VGEQGIPGDLNLHLKKRYEHLRYLII